MTRRLDPDVNDVESNPRWPRHLRRLIVIVISVVAIGWLLWRFSGWEVAHDEELDHLSAFKGRNEIVITGTFHIGSMEVLDYATHEFRDGNLYVRLYAMHLMNRRGEGHRIFTVHIPLHKGMPNAVIMDYAVEPYRVPVKPLPVPSFWRGLHFNSIQTN